MLQDGGELVKHPSKRIHGKENLQGAHAGGIPLQHECEVEGEEENILEYFQVVSVSRYDEPVLVQQRRLAGVVDGDGLLFVVVGDEIDEAGGRVDDAAFVYGVDDFLAWCRAEKILALREDGHFEGW